MDHIDRRKFLRATASLAGSALFAPSLAGLTACGDAFAPGGRRKWPAPRGSRGFGRLVAAGPELLLPPSFRYRVLSREGMPMSDGGRAPGAYDGMACFADPDGGVRLVRNHEIGGVGEAFGDPNAAYDPHAGGGTTTLVLNADREVVREFGSLNGTSTNCAGGPTPWGTWLTCEETTAGIAQGHSRPHGYVFEVPALGDGFVVAPEPYPAMGRFKHEAVAVDPATGIVYLTEDQHVRHDGEPGSLLLGAGLYRFLPDRYGDLRTGRLQMLATAGRRHGSQVVATGQRQGRPIPVRWIDIEDPDPADADTDEMAVARQGADRGAVLFARLEGAWWGDGTLYFVSPSGGDAACGQVWQYRPLGATKGLLTLVFESPGPELLDGPDNVVVTPRGGLLLCEDGRGEQFIRGLTRDGEIFDFALNRMGAGEFAGATFSPDGETLFVNVQRPGTTFAIWGEW